MPVYEYYCPECHLIMQFFSRVVTTSRVPVCPHCLQKILQRKPSRFGYTWHSSSDSGQMSAEFAGIDENQFALALQSMEQELAAVDQNDPKASAVLLRRFSEKNGLEITETMQEALQRMESGEDPEIIEQQLGGALGEDDPGFIFAHKV